MYRSFAWLCVANLVSSVSRVVLSRPSDSKLYDDGSIAGLQASVIGSNNSLLGEGDQLNDERRSLQCTQHPTWFRSWTDHMHAQYYEAACDSAWRNMRYIELRRHGDETFEFLSKKSTPKSKFRPMKTPRRYSGSM